MKHKGISPLGQTSNRLKKPLIVIETQELFQTYSHNTEWLQPFSQNFQSLVDQSGPFKVLIVSYVSTTAVSPAMAGVDIRIVASIPRAIPVRAAKRHIARRKRRHAVWEKMQPSF